MPITTSETGMTMAVGAAAVRVFGATALKIALKHYRPGGVLMNRAYTPSRMLATASTYTGKHYSRGQYQQAATDLEAWINDQVKAGV